MNDKIIELHDYPDVGGFLKMVKPSWVLPRLESGKLEWVTRDPPVVCLRRKAVLKAKEYAHSCGALIWDGTRLVDSPRIRRMKERRPGLTKRASGCKIMGAQLDDLS